MIPRALFPLAAALTVAACAQGTQPAQQAATLAQAKAWAAVVSGVVAGAAAGYTGPNADQVRQGVADLQAAVAVFQTLGDVSTGRSAALSLVAMAQQLAPLVAPALGPKAAYVSMGLAVLQAFVAALPVPPAAASMPPAGVVGR